MQTSNVNNKGYISIVIKQPNNNLQTIIALLDTGNSLSTHCCIRSDIAKSLNLPIIKKKLSVGSASSKYNLKAIGTTSFIMYIRIEGNCAGLASHHLSRSCSGKVKH